MKQDQLFDSIRLTLELGMARRVSLHITGLTIWIATSFIVLFRLAHWTGPGLANFNDLGRHLINCTGSGRATQLWFIQVTVLGDCTKGNRKLHERQLHSIQRMYKADFGKAHWKGIARIRGLEIQHDSSRGRLLGGSVTSICCVIIPFTHATSKGWRWVLRYLDGSNELAQKAMATSWLH